MPYLYRNYICIIIIIYIYILINNKSFLPNIYIYIYIYTSYYIPITYAEVLRRLGYVESTQTYALQAKYYAGDFRESYLYMALLIENNVA